MTATDLARLETWDPDSGALNVIIETSRGSRNKLKYNPELELFELSKVLPLGMNFPYDFGYIPSTLAEDGDPLDVLMLLDEPVPAGCRVPARLLGVIEADQTEDGKTMRNDRLIAVSVGCHQHRDVHSVKDLGDHLLDGIESFFIFYNDAQGRQFKPIARHGPNHAEKLVQKAAKRFRERDAGAGDPQGNGKKQKGAKK
jgi:inorganic pyrophosphatase